MAKHSKATLALLDRYPDFDDWIINNLSPSELIKVRDTRLDVVSPEDKHPLTDQALGVQLWRAYKSSVVFELRTRWPDGGDFYTPPAGCDRLAYFHKSVWMAVGLFAADQPELLDRTVERHRREIEDAIDSDTSCTAHDGVGGRMRL